jgi:hypothetical protein
LPPWLWPGLILTWQKENDGNAEITGGLTEGEVIVIEKLSQMQDNLAIKPVSSATD